MSEQYKDLNYIEIEPWWKIALDKTGKKVIIKTDNDQFTFNLNPQCFRSYSSYLNPQNNILTYRKPQHEWEKPNWCQYEFRIVGEIYTEYFLGISFKNDIPYAEIRYTSSIFDN